MLTLMSAALRPTSVALKQPAGHLSVALPLTSEVSVTFTVLPPPTSTVRFGRLRLAAVCIDSVAVVLSLLTVAISVPARRLMLLSYRVSPTSVGRKHALEHVSVATVLFVFGGRVLASVAALAVSVAVTLRGAYRPTTRPLPLGPFKPLRESVAVFPSRLTAMIAVPVPRNP